MQDVFEHIRDRLGRLPRESVPTPLEFRFDDGAAVRYERTPDAIRMRSWNSDAAAPVLEPGGLCFRLDDLDTLARLIRGEEDLLAAFMDDRIRSDGFLVTAVMLLGAFADRPEAE